MVKYSLEITIMNYFVVKGFYPLKVHLKMTRNKQSNVPVFKDLENGAVVVFSWFSSKARILSLWALSSHASIIKPTLQKTTVIKVRKQQKPTRRREDPLLAALVIVYCSMVSHI